MKNQTRKRKLIAATNRKLLVIHGPARSGKTLNKEALRLYFKCSHAFDDGEIPKEELEGEGTILLLSQESKWSKRWPKKQSLDSISCIEISYAKRLLGKRWLEPIKGHSDTYSKGKEGGQ